VEASARLAAGAPVGAKAKHHEGCLVREHEQRPRAAAPLYICNVWAGFAKAMRLSKRNPNGAIALLEANVEERRRFYGEDDPQC
jgi:hypothetical protein